MSVTCQDLLTLKYFERIKLVAGPNGLERTVTWALRRTDFNCLAMGTRRRAAVYYRHCAQRR